MWQGEENKLMELEVNKNKALNEVEISYKEKISNVDANPLLNSEKGKIIGYKKKDINNLSKYSKEITKDNLNKSKIIEQNERVTFTVNQRTVFIQAK